MSKRVNGIVAFVAALAALATLAVDGGPFRGADEGAWRAAVAVVDGDSVTARFPPSLGNLDAVDTLSFELAVNDGGARAPVAIVDDLAANRSVRLRFVEGAGAADGARLRYSTGASAQESLPVRVDTPPDALPGPRWGSAVAQSGATAFAFGGSVTVPSREPGGVPESVLLQSILVIDLDTGVVRTSRALLPEPTVAAAAVFDPRPTPECPQGCAYVLGGATYDLQVLDTITRYDPVTDTAVALDVRLPGPRFDYAAVWTGTHAILAGGGAPAQRWDPVTGEFQRLPTTILVSAYALAGTFDPRVTPTCPAGCAYLFGGREFMALPGGIPNQRDAIVRVDALTGAHALVPARLPVPTESISVAWDGSRAILLGGRTCSPEACERSDQALAFDPLDGRVTELPRPIPERPENAPAVWHDAHAVLVGGKEGQDALGMLDRLVRYAPGE